MALKNLFGNEVYMALTFTQEQLDALTEAYALGATKVQIGDRVLEYRSLSDMRKIIEQIKASLAGGVDTSTTSVSNVPYTWKQS